MGCWHGGYHGCGPWHGPYGWYEPADWYGEDGPVRSGYRRDRRYERVVDVDELEARLADLRGEIRRVEGEIVNLRGAGEAARQKP